MAPLLMTPLTGRLGAWLFAGLLVGCASRLPAAPPPLLDLEEPLAWFAEPDDEAARQALPLGTFSGCVVDEEDPLLPAPAQVERQGDDEGRATQLGIADDDVAAVELDDVATDRETYACARDVGVRRDAVPALEHLLALGFLDARPRVVDDDAGAPSALNAGAFAGGDIDEYGHRAPLRGELDGVDDEVRDELLELSWITPDVARAGGLDAEANGSIGGEALEEARGLLHQRGKIEAMPAARQPADRGGGRIGDVGLRARGAGESL